MPLNIKNERVTLLAQELSQLTGESITDAVGHALESRLSEVRGSKSREGLATRLLEIGKQCATQAPPGWRERDFDSELYDEQGLPR